MTHVGFETAHPRPATSPDFNWDDMRLFLKVAERGSVRAVSTETGHTHAFIRNRIKALEICAKAVLFSRSNSGLAITEEGQRLLFHARNIQRQAAAALAGMRRPELRSTVRLGITEGLGVFWLAPMIGELRSEHPDIQFDLRCSMDLPRISELEVDLAIQLEKPKDPELIVKKIGRLHVVLYASERYIAAHGAPERSADIHNFHFIEVVGPQIRSEQVEETMTTEDKRGFVNLRANSSSAQFIAAMSGLGVTAFPTYVPVISSGLQHVAQDYVLARDIWLAYHPHSADLSHVRRTIDWVIRSFDSIRFPWFKDQYMSPSEIAAFMAGQSRKSLFTPACVLQYAS